MSNVKKIIATVLSCVIAITCLTLSGFAEGPILVGNSVRISPDLEKTKTFSYVYNPTDVEDLVVFSVDITITGTYSDTDNYAQINTVVVSNMGGLDSYVANTTPFIQLDFNGPESAYVAFAYPEGVFTQQENGIFMAYIFTLHENGNITVVDLFNS